jgi:hypothetical protein
MDFINLFKSTIDLRQEILKDMTWVYRFFHGLPILIDVAYLQSKTRLDWLAKNYLFDSDPKSSSSSSSAYTIALGTDSHEATLSVWWP